MSLSEPGVIWNELAQEVVWDKPYTSVLDDIKLPAPNWFVGGEINMSYNCLDKHVNEGYGSDTALIFESSFLKKTEKITYETLLDSVELLAGLMVKKCNIEKGTRVLIYFPVIPQCFIGMLACTRIGAIYSVVFGGFPPTEIAARMNILQPKLILTCNTGYESGKSMNFKENVDLAIEKANFKPDYCIVYNRPNTAQATLTEGRDLDWITEIEPTCRQCPRPLESNHPMFISFTSGTTGEPKGLIQATGNSVVCDKYLMKYLFALKPQEVFWMFSDFGWITGQTIMSYGPLLIRASTIIFEGDPITDSDRGTIFRILNRNKVVYFISSPKICKLLKNNCSDKELQLSYIGLRAAMFAGDKSDPELIKWATQTFKCPIYSAWSQTELSGSGIIPILGFKNEKSKHPVPTLGVNPIIVDGETGEPLPHGTIGRLLFKTPVSPSMAIGFYNNCDKFLATYFSNYKGYYDTMDFAVIRSDGSIEIVGRADDIIKVSAIRFSAGALEEICLKNEYIIDAIVIPKDDLLSGQIPFALLIKNKVSKYSNKEIIDKTIDLMNVHVGKHALFHHAVIVSDFPKNNSGKILKKSLTSMINNKEYKVPSTVRNVESFRNIHEELTKAGYVASLPIDL